MLIIFSIISTTLVTVSYSRIPYIRFCMDGEGNVTKPRLGLFGAVYVGFRYRVQVNSIIGGRVGVGLYRKGIFVRWSSSALRGGQFSFSFFRQTFSTLRDQFIVD